jgi:hypothetical protein
MTYSDEQLDALIEARLNEAPVSPTNEDEVGIIAHLIDPLVQLGHLQVPDDLAARVQARIDAQIDRYKQRRAITLPFLPSSFRHAPLKVRIAAMVMGIVVIFAVGALGISTVAAHSLPGDPFYNIKIFQQSIALNQAGSQDDKAAIAIQQLRDALADLQKTVTDRRSDDQINMAINTLADRTSTAQSLINNLPSDSQQRDDFVFAIQQEKSTLRALLSNGSWNTRVVLSTQLGRLSDPIPAISSATAFQAGNLTTVVITGTTFEPGAHFTLNGSSNIGIIVFQSPTKIVVNIPSIRLPDGRISVGIQNPDGTATQYVLFNDGHHGGGKGIQPYPTPVPGGIFGTPEPPGGWWWKTPITSPTPGIDNKRTPIP